MKDKYKRVKIFEGTLDEYYETGFESLLIHLYKDNHESLNPNYDPKDSSKGPSHYRDWSGIVPLELGDVVEILDCTDQKLINKHILIGNLEEARKDGFRLGKAYPFELTMIEWIKLISEKAKIRVYRKIRKIALYGGSFDPVHKGHEQIVDNLSYHFDEILVLLSVNWMKKQATFSVDERLLALGEAFKKTSKDNVTVLNWAKYEDTSSTWKMVQKIKKMYGIDPHIVIGSDSLEHLPKWKNWEKLKDLQFEIFKRNKNEKIDTSFLTKCQVWQSKIVEASSTEVKENKKLELLSENVKKVLDLSKIGVQNGK